MNRYRAYRDYQDVPADWLGRIPTTWKAARLGQYFEERRKKVSDKDFQPLSVTMRGVVPQLDTAAKTDAGDNRKKVCPGDFVINSRSDRKGSSGVSQLEGSVSLISIVLRPRNIDPAFIHYLLRSQPFQEEFYRYGKGIVADLWSTNYSEMKNILIPIPSIDEQNSIAAFLDHETAKIDRLIARQERLIELLKEKRQAVISHAVTKGLNPDAPMKDSGVEWLGEVPVHWEVSKIKFHVTTFEQGWSPQCENRLAEDGEFGVLKVGCVNSGTFNASEHKALPPELDPRTEYRLLKGDLLVSRANTRELVGSAAVVDKDYRWLLLCDKLYRIRLDNRCLPEFLSYFLGIRVVRDQIELGSSGASQSMQNIGQDTIKNLPLPLPGNSEAKDILEFVRDKLERFSLLEERTRTAIELMKEHRTALISAAVTGKIDVRDWRKPNTEPQEATTAVSA